MRGANMPGMAELLTRVNDVLARERAVVEDQLRRNGVTVLHGAATFVDPHTVAVVAPTGRRTLTAANVLIAVGTRPASPPGIETDGTSVLTSDDIPRLERLPRSLAVVGGGVIGVEYASMFAALGVQVTLVERRARVLEFVDDEIVDELVHQMRNGKVTFRMGEAVDRLERTDGPSPRVVLLLESGKRIVADAVLFSAGRIGATEGLGLAAAGLAADGRGRLAVGDDFRTAGRTSSRRVT